MADREALATFRLALDLVRDRGISSYRDCVEMLIHQADLFSIEFTSAKEERPNGLYVWQHGERSIKVLDVIWSDGAMPLMLAYRSGTWEKLLRHEAAGVTKVGDLA
jgi:hypothetical protein